MEKNLTVLKIHIIRFGGITEQVYSFEDGVNIIYGENRSGKTTLCEFIRFMYYAFENRDPEDYYPYGTDNHSVCGSMTVKYGTKILEIFREKNEHGETLAITDVEKNLPVTLESSPGEYFLGISSALYDKSLYCPQDMAGLTSSGELANYENELIKAYSGQEDFSGIVQNLQDAKKSLENPEKSGKADILRAERAALEGDLVSAIMKQNDIMNVGAVIAETENKLLEVEKKRVLAKAELEELHGEALEAETRRITAAQQETERCRKTWERLSALAKTDEEMAVLEREYEALCAMGDNLTQLEERLANTKSNLDMHTVMVTTEQHDRETLEDVSEKVQNRTKLAHRLFIASLPLFVLAALTFVVLFLAVKTLTLNQVVWISAGVAVLSLGSLTAAVIVLLSRNLLYNKLGMSGAEEFEDAYELMLSLCKTTDLYRDTYRDEARAYKEKAEEYSRCLSALAVKLNLSPDTASAEDAEERLEELRIACRKAATALEEYQAVLEEHRRYTSEEVKKAVEAKTLRRQQLEKELAEYNEESTALFEHKRSFEEVFSTAVIHTERPVYIKTRLNEIQKQLEEYEKDLEALDIAREVLEDAFGVMKFRIKSHLADGVNSALKFTLSESESFLVDDSYSLQYKNGTRLMPVFTDTLARISRAGKGISRSLCEMSALAMRISLIKMLEADITAAVLDEPFAFIDTFGEDKMLKKLSNSGFCQVLLFTSHSIEGAQEKYNCINL
ncbi:MAG: hypothetical protein E7588_05055 [Ruminococcaceae bacterium]|nr:hypothetical protein [Oscillospiraceae bacterium]